MADRSLYKCHISLKWLLLLPSRLLQLPVVWLHLLPRLLLQLQVVWLPLLPRLLHHPPLWALLPEMDPVESQ